MFDLNYFKYCFLKPSGLEFDEMALQDDFELLCADLLGGPQSTTFLYRDFNSRNVMVHSGDPYFIDFQGGMQGPTYYDVASFVWHARSGYPEQLKQMMLDAYLASLGNHIEVDAESFRLQLKKFVLLRSLQVLGAYGFRGLMEQKANFVTGIPAAIAAL
jgi:aminoglycoside/choline kinase family phosphotransferase